jgi:hypothetical protein
MGPERMSTMKFRLGAKMASTHAVLCVDAAACRLDPLSEACAAPDAHSRSLALYPTCGASAGRTLKASHSTSFTRWVHTLALCCVPTASLLLQGIVCNLLNTTDAAQPFVEPYKRQADCRLAHPVQCRFDRGCTCQVYITVGLAVQAASTHAYWPLLQTVSTSS